MGTNCIVLLEAGSIIRFEQSEEHRSLSVVEACEKIARHWKRIRFSEWSDSDAAWLCLLTDDRPKIEDIVAALFPVAEGQQNTEVLQ